MHTNTATQIPTHAHVRSPRPSPLTPPTNICACSCTLSISPESLQGLGMSVDLPHPSVRLLSRKHTHVEMPKLLKAGLSVSLGRSRAPWWCSEGAVKHTYFFYPPTPTLFIVITALAAKYLWSTLRGAQCQLYALRPSCVWQKERREQTKGELLVGWCSYLLAKRK